MTKKIWSRTFLATATITTAGAGLTGLASAASISNTGPGSFNLISEGHGSDGNHSYDYQMNGWSGHDTKWADEWENWNPDTWKHEGKSFDSWYNGCQNWLSKHSDYKFWNNGRDSDNHSYGGKDWSSWNPQQYEHEGGSYGAWYAQMMRYMNDNYGTWQGNWSDNQGGRGSDNDEHSYARDNHDQGGYGGNNVEEHHNRETTTVRNDNDVTIHNDVRQTAVSGDATSSHNTWGGEVYSGNATNNSENNFEVNVDNSSSTDWATGGGGSDQSWDRGSLRNTGPFSDNRIRFSNEKTTTVNNDNDVHINNNVSQTAVTGDATSSHNTHGGEVYSGDASNYSSNSFMVSITN